MKKLVVTLLSTMSFAAFAVGTVTPFAGDPNLLRGNGVVVSGTKYVDQTLASGSSQRTEFVAFEGNPFDVWCAGEPIRINTDQVGRITAPLDLSRQHQSPINVIVRVDAETGECHLQTVNPRS